MALRWLHEEIGPGHHAHWPAESFHGDATAFHVRTIEDAARLQAAAPLFGLADST
jgi:hypothetical protein